jgi:homospermidine synthase
MNHIYFIGCGGVGFALLEVFNKENLFYDCLITIIEPREIEDIKGVMKNRKYEHLTLELTRTNYKKLLEDVDEKSYIINVSVNVDSIMILEHAKKCNAWYIDTSLEQYQDFIHVPIQDITNYNQFKKNNLYHQNLKAFKTIGKSPKTRIISGGMNPAFINEYTKRALVEYGKLHNKQLEKGNYAKLGYELGLCEIQVVEYDTQKLKIKSTPTKFVSDWSPVGFQEEAGDTVMLSLNNDDIKKLEKEGYNLIKPTEGDKNTHIRFIAARGMDMKRESITLDDKGKPFKFEGLLVPHAEIISMSEFFSYRGNAPTIMYIYRPCDEALRGLQFFKDNDYKILPDFKTVRNKDVISGWDSICCLLKFKNGNNYIGGTICGKKDATRMKFKSNATTIQVAGFMLGAICWSLENPKEGLNNAETIPNAYIFEMGEKYMGLSIKGLLV